MDYKVTVLKEPVVDGPLMRIRFQVPNSTAPVNWPIPYPSWCTGSGDKGSYVVTYAKNIAELLKNWPDAFDIDVLSEGEWEYTYTDRFAKPSYMTPEGMAAALEQYKGYPVYSEAGTFTYDVEGYHAACRAMRKFPDAEAADVEDLDVKDKIRIHEANAKVWATPVELQATLINAPTDPAMWATHQLYRDLKMQVRDIIDREAGLDNQEGLYVTNVIMSNIGATLQGDGINTGYFVAERSNPTVDLSLYMASYFNDINS